MHRAALALCGLFPTLAPCVKAFAHGEPPAAYGVVSHDTQGARAVRLSAGVALRRAPQRFQFVCPSAWGDQYPAPLAALADGTIVVGATRGLMLLSEDGQVRAHPDPLAVGDSRDVVRSPYGVFSLRATQEGSEVLAVDAQSVRVLWKDPNSLYSLAALDDKLVLVRANGASVEQVTIAAADGAELDRQAASVGARVDYAFARATADAPYALVLFGASAVLGSLHLDTFTKIAEGELSIAGPLNAAEGTFLALDGKLAQLVGGEAMPLPVDALVLCLEQNDGLAYACHPDGIARLNGPALGEPLFQLSWLVAPNLTLLAAGPPHYDCNAQWQDLRADLLTFGTTLRDDVLMDAGSAAVAASSREGGIEYAFADASIADGANGGPAKAAAGTSRKGSAGCGALPSNDAHRPGYAAALGLVLLLVQRRGGDTSPLRARRAQASRAATGSCGAARFGKKAARR